MGSLEIMLKGSTFGLLLILGLASASAVGLTRCEYCVDFVSVLWGHFTQGHGVAFQTYVLDEDICPDRDDVAACKQQVAFYWPGINHVLFDEAKVTPFCTAATGLDCSHPDPPAQQLRHQKLGNITDCDECIGELAAYGSTIMFPELDSEAERMLQGEWYCTTPSLGFNLHQRADCVHFLQGLIAPAMAAFDLRLVTYSQNICHFWYGVCHGE